MPELGKQRLDKPGVRDVQGRLNKLGTECQCCLQHKDARRPAGHADPGNQRRCCAVGKCCNQLPRPIFNETAPLNRSGTTRITRTPL